MNPTEYFIKFLQSCITPVALISGVGLLLLTITNRLGRTIDRTRTLVSELDKEGIKRRSEKENEVRILYRRSRYLRLSIASITLSILTSSLMIPLLVIMTITKIDMRLTGYILFVLSIIAIVISAILFFMDVLLSLRALLFEAKEYVD